MLGCEVGVVFQVEKKQGKQFQAVGTLCLRQGDVVSTSYPGMTRPDKASVEWRSRRKQAKPLDSFSV
jgi:hypothetical protein